MTKKSNDIPVKYFTSIIIAVVFFLPVFCQDTSSQHYKLAIHFVDKDSSFSPEALQLQTMFLNQPQCLDYVRKLIPMLNMKGYMAASVDEMSVDSSAVRIKLYVGKLQNWIQLKTDSIDKRAVDEAGFIEKRFSNKPVNFQQLQLIKEHLLNYYEKNGYPFASVYLDSIQLVDQSISANLKLSRGPLYHVDSIRISGKAKIDNLFLQRYLGIPNGSIYNREKLEQVNKKMLELPYVQSQQPAELLMLGTGSVLNLYLQPKKSSQVNFIIGFLPANSLTNKLQLTGDVNLNLKNSFSKGETILLNWQQLQLQSPKLNIGYQQPYFLKSPFGIDFSFGLFKKDSTYLQLNGQLGIQYLMSANQSGSIFLQSQSTTLLASGIDSNQIKQTKTLPPNIDVSAVNVGLNYSWNNTNYRLNPRSGNEFQLLTTVGIKTIHKNSDIINLQDTGSFNYATLYDSLKLKTYQIRINLTAAHYFPAGKRSTLKTVINAGIYGSQNIFRNELFQIGGFKLLRGFDEESIYATQYGVFTAEYRYLAGQNSYLFTFLDAGWVKDKFQYVNTSNTFISAGLGLLFETKVGLLNMSLAVGKRNDVNFDLRNAAKIHFGYINYF